MANGRDANSGHQKFGTFGGVFTPNVLTILGVIMFLRFGQITGQAGIVQGLLILLAAKLITSLTAVSLAAIATNTRVKAGGAYYLISRSLGVEFGGGIALVFYLAQAISVAMYVIGFAEAVTATFPSLGFTGREVASVANIAVFAVVIVGAGWTIKVQYGILAVLVIALVSFAMGAVHDFSPELLAANWRSDYAPGQDIVTMFALFFPAATGIMAGANMSGDLRDPAKSLPLGTFAAIGVTGLVYLLLIVALGGSADRSTLLTNSFVMHDIAVWPSLIVAGVFAATLSSALGSMLGAPRILQAFARDGVFQKLKFLGKGSGTSDEPRRAVVLTALVSQAAISLGDLNAIAPIITMFFMVTYGTLNIACFYEGYSHNPSFRPRFRYSHWTLALAAALGCAVAMFLMDALWAIAALVAVGALYAAIQGIGVRARWGDVRSGVAFERARKALLRLERQPIHPKNWRPIVLALRGASGRHQIAEYGYWLTAGKGVLSIGQVITGEVDDRLDRGYQAERMLRQAISKEGLEAFPAVVIDDDVLEGVKALLQCHGVGGIRPNTVVLGWSDDIDDLGSFTDVLRLAAHLRRNIVVIKREQQREPWSVAAGDIHIWWHGRRNGPLMLILAHLLAQNPEFRDRRFCLIQVVPEEAARESAHEHLSDITKRARVDAEPVTVVSDSLHEAVVNTSRTAALVLFGFQPPEGGDHIRFFQEMEVLTNGLSDVMLVHASQDLDLDS
ncbi:MAG: amino acid permease [Gammaproteobacteria bacterium]